MEESLSPIPTFIIEDEECVVYEDLLNRVITDYQTREDEQNEAY
jgi:hypothetical protein